MLGSCAIVLLRQKKMAACKSFKAVNELGFSSAVDVIGVSQILSGRRGVPSMLTMKAFLKIATTSLFILKVRTFT